MERAGCTDDEVTRSVTPFIIKKITLNHVNLFELVMRVNVAERPRFDLRQQCAVAPGIVHE